MTAELRKLSALPTPRWTLAATFAAVALAALIAALAGTGPAGELIPVQFGLGLPTSVAAIVLGAWIVGLEYGQKTMRRALSADPSRSRLLLAKLAVVLGAVAVVTLALSALSAPLFSAIASGHGESIPVAEALEYGVAALASNLVYATAGFALALVTRSMAGGMALALAFAFVIDLALAAIPSVGQYALSSGVIELQTEISGDEHGAISGADPDIVRAIGVTVVWLTALVGVSVTRFTRSDVD